MACSRCGLAGGALVVLFALICEVVAQQAFSGLFSAARRWRSPLSPSRSSRKTPQRGEKSIAVDHDLVSR